LVDALDTFVRHAQQGPLLFRQKTGRTEFSMSMTPVETVSG
jgi:hypothetical protein